MADSEAILRWETPPETAPIGRGKFDKEAVLADLKEDPSEWAVIAEGVSPSYATTSPAVKWLQGHGCEVRVARPERNGPRCVYARFMPQGRREDNRGRRAAAA